MEAWKAISVYPERASFLQPALVSNPARIIQHQKSSEPPRLYLFTQMKKEDKVMNRSAALEKLDAEIVARLLGNGPWPADAESIPQLDRMILELARKEEVGLLMAFLGIGEWYDFLWSPEEHGLITEVEGDYISNFGKTTTSDFMLGVMRHLVRRAYLRYCRSGYIEGNNPGERDQRVRPREWAELRRHVCESTSNFERPGRPDTSSGDTAHTARVWDVTTSKEIAVLEGAGL
jgi:hypothetical protein